GWSLSTATLSGTGPAGRASTRASPRPAAGSRSWTATPRSRPQPESGGVDAAAGPTRAAIPAEWTPRRTARPAAIPAPHGRDPAPRGPARCRAGWETLRDYHGAW